MDQDDQAEGIEQDEVEADPPEVEETEGEEVETEVEEEVTVSIGDEPPPEDADQAGDSSVIKQVRERNRGLADENRKLKQQLEQTQPAQKPVELGPKPTLASCDYDEERLEREWDEWHQRKAAQDTAQAEAKKVQDQAAQQWKAKHDTYTEQKKSLKVSGFDEAEALVTDALSDIQQGILVKASKNAAHIVYALGKNPTELKRLQAIQDPVEFTWAAAQLETKLKVTPRKTAPLPETTPRGSAPVSGAVETKRKQLEAEADRTNDRTKLIAFNKAQTKKAA